MELVAKLARVRIGDDVFQSGDGLLLPSITLTLGEDARSSSCRFTVNDPGLTIGAKYREISVKAGGIDVPSDLLAAASSGGAGGGAAAPASTSGAISANVGIASIDSAFEGGSQSLIARAVGTSEGNRTPDGGFNSSYKGHTDPGNGVANIGSFSYQVHQGGASTPEEADALWLNRLKQQMPNYAQKVQAAGLDPNDGRLLANFTDLYTQAPAAAVGQGGFLDRLGEIKAAGGSYEAILQARLNSYRNPSSGALDAPGFGNSLERLTADQQRRMQALESVLAKSPGAPPAAAPAPLTPPAAAPASPAAPAQTPPVVEASKKGTEIIIELAVGWGLTFKDAIAFHFIHTGTETAWDASGAQTTTFEGLTIRWLLTRTPVTESFQGTTFKQYLEARCKSFGLELEMEGDGLKYEHLSQDGQTHLDLILREARRIGFVIKEGIGEKSGTLIAEPAARPEFTNFIIDEEVLIKPARFSDKARGALSGAPGATVSSPETGAGETATAIDRATGEVKQTQPESKAGTGAAADSTGSSAGAATPPVGGTVAPAPDAATTPPAPAATPAPAPNAATPAAPPPAEVSELAETKEDPPKRVIRADGAAVTTQRTRVTKGVAGKVTVTTTTSSSIVPTSGLGTSEKKIEVAEITDAGKTTVTTIERPGQPPEVSAPKTSTPTAEEKRLLEISKRPPASTATAPAAPGSGLPNQAAGAIDLADGRAEAQLIADESKRVKGYEDSYVLVMNMDTLQLVPGQIVALSKRLFLDPFATEKRTSTVEHNFEAGTTTLNTYVPQAPLPGASGPVQMATPTGPPGAFIFPIPAGATTIGDGYGTRANRDMGYRHTILDVTAPGGTPCVAMADGNVTYTGFDGGAGNLLEIEYAGGYKSIYMHGYAPDPFIVTSGPVKQGQPVFRVGTTGSSSGDHLHLKFTLGGSYCLLSKVNIDVLKMGLPIERYNEGCNQY